jgi:hypothetical protein
LARAEAAQSALDKFAAAKSPRSRDEALAALVAVHGARLNALAGDVERRRTDAESWLAYAYRIQMRLDKEMDMNHLEKVKHPAGLLIRASGPPPPIALGEIRLPAQKDLSSLAVNPYKVDSWPIEPNSRGAKASGELSMPPIRDAPEEEEDAPESDYESDNDDGFPRALPGWRFGQSPGAVPEDDEEDEDDGDEDEAKISGEDDAELAADNPPTPVRGLGLSPEGSPGDVEPPSVDARSPSPDVGMMKAPPKRLPPLALGK